MGWLSKKEIGTEAFLDQGQSAVPQLFGELGGSALYPEPNFQNHVQQAWSKNELVYSCIMEKATSLPEAPLRVYAGDGLGEPRENHPLRLLMANPNTVLTEFEMMEMTIIHLDLAGNAFWEIVLDNAGEPKELWPLRPDRVRIIPRRNGQHQYAYVMGDGKVVDLGANVIHFKLPNPIDPYVGQAPLRSVLRAVALDNEATDFVKVLLQNRAVPGTVIETEQRLDEELANRLTDKWMSRFGKNRNGRPAFLQKGMKVHPLGLNLNELEFPDLRTISESRICMSLGVPPILVGAKVGLDRSTFANYGEARSSFWEETLMPLQTRIQSAIAKKLMPYFEGPRPRRTVVRFDNSNVRALRESEGRRWELATQALRAGAITVNTFNRMVGLPKVSDGDVYLIPAGVAPVSSPAEAPASQPAEEPTPPSEEQQQEPTPPSEEQQPPKALNGSVAKMVRPGHRGALAAAVVEFVRRQQEAEMDNLDRAKSARILASSRENWHHWDEDLASVLVPRMKQIARSAARRVDKDHDPAVMDTRIERAALAAATAWNERTRSEVAVAAKGVGWYDGVEAVFALAADRASALADALTVDMTGLGAVDTAKRVGIGYKTWVANGDGRHGDLDGETVPVDKNFSNGARWPGDSDEGRACTCSVTFSGGSG